MHILEKLVSRASPETKVWITQSSADLMMRLELSHLVFKEEYFIGLDTNKTRHLYFYDKIVSISGGKSGITIRMVG